MSYSVICVSKITFNVTIRLKLLEDTDDPNINCDNLESFQNINTILKSCKSYDKISFNRLPYSSNKVSEKSDVTLFSSYFLNIDGNLSNFDSFTAEIHQLKNTFSIIGLAETNCNPDNKELYHITNYTSFYQNTITINGVGKKKGSGVAIYVHNSLNAIHDATKSVISPDIETLFLSITNTPKPVTVGVVYRPPNGNMLLFLDQYRQIINSLQDKTSYIMADFNINLHSNSSPSKFCEYEQILLN